ncbi:hypothetical protein HAX54_031963, partial [Datura stramonium]|nr:hypothetical protein [Datura stramonium]
MNCILNREEQIPIDYDDDLMGDEDGYSAHYSAVTTCSGRVLHSKPNKHMGANIINEYETSPDHVLVNEEVVVGNSIEEEAKDEVVELSMPSPQTPNPAPPFPERLMKKNDDAKLA